MLNRLFIIRDIFSQQILCVIKKIKDNEIIISYELKSEFELLLQYHKPYDDNVIEIKWFFEGDPTIESFVGDYIKTFKKPFFYKNHYFCTELI